MSSQRAHHRQQESARDPEHDHRDRDLERHREALEHGGQGARHDIEIEEIFAELFHQRPR
jgi:hypothetical protein